jgi:hypothetical protein
VYFLVRVPALLGELSLTLVPREFKDSKGIFYPSTTKLLVIVAKHPDGPRKSFPFELRLEKEMRVAVHHIGMVARVTRFLERPKTADSWCFKIKAPYSPCCAKEALADAQHADSNKQLPSIVGLHAAAKPWMDAVATCVFVP